MWQRDLVGCGAEAIQLLKRQVSWLRLDHESLGSQTKDLPDSLELNFPLSGLVMCHHDKVKNPPQNVIQVSEFTL